MAERIQVELVELALLRDCLYALRYLVGEHHHLRQRGVWVEKWVKIVERNEPLDCANYNRCAFKSIKFDLDAWEQRLYGTKKIKPADTSGRPKRPKGLISSGIKV